jgi:Dolichyl-phosphate-mannose-protein mannosyltransferase
MTKLWLRLPLLAVAIALGLASVCAVAVRWSEPLPISPWEPAIAMEAVRLNAGMPLYEPGHATQIYGPLLPALIAGVFRIFGFNLLAARIVFSFFGFALAALLAAILCRRRSGFLCLLAFLLFLGVNFRANLIFLTAQPDCAALFFALLGLYLWATRKRAWRRWTMALILFVVAFLFKQTAAAFTLIPLVYALLWARPLKSFAAVTALVPCLIIFAAIGLIEAVWPHLYFAMIAVPAAIRVNLAHAPGITLYLLGTFPLFIVAVLATLWLGRRDERERWVWAALIVLVPVSIWTICKSGGSYNSLLPAYLAMTALFVVELDCTADWLGSLPPVRGFLASTLLAAAVFLSVFVQPDRDVALLFARVGDDKRGEAIAIARRLGPQTVSPQDPSVAYLANGYFGRSLYFELDTHARNGNWPEQLPDSLKQELAHARYVVRVKSYVPTPVFDRYLLAAHFEPMSLPELEGSAYAFFKRD